MDLIEEIEKKIGDRDSLHSNVVMVGFLEEIRDEIKRLRAERDEAVRLLEPMTYYAGLIVDPHAHGSIYPDKALEELNAARDFLAALEGK